ncbi:ECF RNA polymerase sigma factor SigE [Pirellulimonas nuda]|uniref:ECF RNA polymerase sigma factor SigE n=1 Tax=Pirellulimonas nuda TaxID=2528009 RepID=A0A518D9N0_9BACT|nr:sigma-70 family RNA polymerase sigma factor [Pirellulimonas nuda]QDU88138.1 ECF RNA polymerase sigma factor SigE [Pirellulimonas nuda]
MPVAIQPPAVTVQPATTLTELVCQHQAGLWRYLRYLGAAAAESEDLVQETFLSVARDGFQERSPAETAGYLRTVARNKLLMLRRKQKREPKTSAIEAADAVWAEAAQDDGLSGWIGALRGCVAQLEGRARQAVEMCYRENAGRDAIAEALDMKPDGVKTLLRRTRALLKACVERRLTTDDTGGTDTAR